ncbi:hypothetical protein MUP77_09850 [Candidatus Bathyarchaeota archaeon]|nr:hypothetical protein [Candidatus Bathyarchaeota archaeon]
MLQKKRLYLGTIIIFFLSSILAFNFSLASAQTPIQYPNAKTEVTISSFGAVQVTRTFRIINTGSNSISETPILLPKDATDIMATDSLGPITFTVTDNETGKIVTITFRYPLKGVEGGVTYNDTYTFFLHYVSSSTSYITQLEFGSFRFQYNASTGVGFPVAQDTIVVTLPEGSTFSSSDPLGYVSALGFNPIVSLNFTNLQPNGMLKFIVDYDFLPIWSAFRPTLWVGTVVAIIGAILLIRRRFGKIESPKGSIHLGFLRSLANSLDEQLGLWGDLDQLEEALDNGSLGRKDYDSRQRILDERSKELSKSVSRLKKNVREVSPRYAKMVDGMETIEKEMISLRSSLSGLRSKFRSSRMSRSSFENQAETIRRRIGKVAASMEAIIIELRVEVR